MITFNCRICNKEKTVYKSDYFNYPIYCSRKCLNISMLNNQYAKGNILSIEVKQRMSNSHKGKKNSLVHCENIRKANLREKSHFWKGGYIQTKKGINFVYNPQHPFSNSNGYVLEHRLVAEQTINRYLKPQEVVHHLDYNCRNNNPENLYIFSDKGSHLKYHLFLRRIVRELIGGIKNEQIFS